MPYISVYPMGSQWLVLKQRGIPVSFMALSGRCKSPNNRKSNAQRPTTTFKPASVAFWTVLLWLVTSSLVASVRAEQARSLATGDVNGDSETDLVIGGPGKDITILAGRQNGTFGEMKRMGTGLPEPTASVAVGVIDKNEHLDIVAGTPRSRPVVAGDKDGNPIEAAAHPDHFAIFRGRGNGVFDRSVFKHDFVVAKNDKFALGDVNGDGRDDIVGGLRYVLVSGDQVSFKARRLLANIQLHGRTVAGQWLGNGAANSPRVFDLNNDGNNDLIWNFAYETPQSDKTIVRLNKGEGNFESMQFFVSGAGVPTSNVLGDLDGDGHGDIVIGDRGNPDLAIAMGGRKGKFMRGRSIEFEQKLPRAATRSVVLGDFDGDHILDIAATISGPNQVFLLLGNGDGTFQKPKRSDVGKNVGDLVTADFNTDSKPDLAVYCRETQVISVLLGNGKGTFHKRERYEVGEQ